MSKYRGYCRCRAAALYLTAKPDFAVYCHCDDCRRSVGAPVLATIGAMRDTVVWENDSTVKRHTIGTATRVFCGMCGSGIAQEHESQPDRFFLNTCFMENPEQFAPTAHTFAGRQLSWLALDDGLPRHDKSILIDSD